MRALKMFFVIVLSVSIPIIVVLSTISVLQTGDQPVEGDTNSEYEGSWDLDIEIDVPFIFINGMPGSQDPNLRVFDISMRAYNPRDEEWYGFSEKGPLFELDLYNPDGFLQDLTDEETLCTGSCLYRIGAGGTHFQNHTFLLVHTDGELYRTEGYNVSAVLLPTGQTVYSKLHIGIVE